MLGLQCVLMLHKYIYIPINYNLAIISILGTYLLPFLTL